MIYKLLPVERNSIPCAYIEYEDGSRTVVTLNNEQYLAWLEAGNTPLPAEEQQ